MGKVMCLTHLYSNEVHFLMKGISWGFLLLCHQILDERVIRILLSCNFEMKKWRNIFCSIVWNFTFSISWLLRHCVDWLIKEIFFCVLPLKLLIHRWILMQNATEVQYTIKWKTKSSFNLYVAKFENLWLENKESIYQSGHVPVFLYQSQLSSQQPPHSFWCTLYYQTELEPICFCPSLSHHTRIFLQASLCLLTTFIAPLGSTVLMSIPASVDILRREAEINPCTKHENNPPPISVSV